MKKALPKKLSKTPDKSGADTISGAILLSHQLMSTLTAMKWSLKMLYQGDFGPISSGQKEIIGKIDERNDLLISLANRVLHTSKLEDGQYCYNQEPVNVEHVINSIMEYCREEASKKGVTMEFKKPRQGIPVITADGEMIKVAVQNIADNAIKYTPPGGTISISLDAGAKNIELKIQDSGMGVPQNQKEHLFHKFFRADNAITSNPVGSGLGLFIAKNIIEAHKGKIWFTSKENQGSAFYVSLPTQTGLPVE